MNEALKQELTGRAPVLASLGGKEYALAFPIHAVIQYKRLTGDSLFDGKCWSKIAPTEDPERFLACLWAGLHVQASDDTWNSPFTIDQLGRLVDFTNAMPLCEAIALALASYFPAAKEKATSDPKPQELAEAEVTATTPTSSEASGYSGPSLVSTLA